MNLQSSESFNSNVLHVAMEWLSWFRFITLQPSSNIRTSITISRLSFTFTGIQQITPQKIRSWSRTLTSLEEVTTFSCWTGRFTRAGNTWDKRSQTLTNSVNSLEEFCSRWALMVSTWRTFTWSGNLWVAKWLVSQVDRSSRTQRELKSFPAWPL